MSNTPASDVQSSFVASNGDARHGIQKSKQTPRVTTSMSPAYIEACARSNEKASQYDPLTVLFQGERLPPLPNEQMFVDEHGQRRPTSRTIQARLAAVSQNEIEKLIYETSVSRLTAKESTGAFVAEAGNFAAVTCWEPMFAPVAPKQEIDTRRASKSLIDPKIFAGRLFFVDYITRIERAKETYLYPILWKAHKDKASFKVLDHWTGKALDLVPAENRNLMYWHLCLTSRNPSVQPPLPGAVRAVIEPFIKRWVDEAGMPAVWLEASSPRAKDVYGYLGFQVVDEVVVGEDEKGHEIRTWCMMYAEPEQPITT